MEKIINTTKNNIVSREDFDKVCEAVWSEIAFQNTLERRGDDEAKDIPAFPTLLRRYVRQVEDNWADLQATDQGNGQFQVTAAVHGLRKLSAICLRSMIYNEILFRK